MVEFMDSLPGSARQVWAEPQGCTAGAGYRPRTEYPDLRHLDIVDKFVLSI
jgi:hypothetical protein